MSRPRKPHPLRVFEENLEDAERLIVLSRVLLNGRKKRMRRELRQTFGAAMRLPQRERAYLDCVESDDGFVILKPKAVVTRDDFTASALQPLLRLAIVAICAAVESYVAEKACLFISAALDNPPARLAAIPLTMGQVLSIERAFRRRRWGYREVVIGHINELASPDPDSIGRAFSSVGKKVSWPAIDQQRQVMSGTSREQLSALYKRRNRIAHAGDRQGTQKALLSHPETVEYYVNAKAIVEALDATLK